MVCVYYILSVWSHKLLTLLSRLKARPPFSNSLSVQGQRGVWGRIRDTDSTINFNSPFLQALYISGEGVGGGGGLDGSR